MIPVNLCELGEPAVNLGEGQMSIVKRTLKRPDPITGRKTAYLVRVEGKRDPATGKRRQLSKQVATMREAKALEADWTAEVARGTALDPNKTTVADLLREWLASKQGDISAQSLRDYEIVLEKHLVPALGDVPVQRLTAARVQQQENAWRDAGMSPRMVRACHMRLAQALRYAVRLGIVAANACDSVNPPKLGKAKAATWNQEEAAVFLDAAMHRPVLTRGGDTGIRRPDDLHPLWHFLVLEGMRRGEALGLRWRDLNIERGTAHIVQTVVHNKAKRQPGETDGRTLIQNRTKTGAGARTVRLTARTLAALKEHRKAQNARRLAASEWQDHDLIICTSKGTPINPTNVQRSFNAILAAARMPDGSPLRRIRVHDLRHTSATLLLLAGTHPKVVSERLGHASISITLDLYSHVLPDAQDSAVAAMDALFDASAGSA